MAEHHEIGVAAAQLADGVAAGRVHPLDVDEHPRLQRAVHQHREVLQQQAERGERQEKSRCREQHQSAFGAHPLGEVDGHKTPGLRQEPRPGAVEDLMALARELVQAVDEVLRVAAVTREGEVLAGLSVEARQRADVGR